MPYTLTVGVGSSCGLGQIGGQEVELGDVVCGHIGRGA